MFRLSRVVITPIGLDTTVPSVPPGATGRSGATPRPAHTERRLADSHAQMIEVTLPNDATDGRALGRAVCH